MTTITPKIGSSHWRNEDKQIAKQNNKQNDIQIEKCSNCDCEFIRNNPRKCRYCLETALKEKRRIEDLQRFEWEMFSFKCQMEDKS